MTDLTLSHRLRVMAASGVDVTITLAPADAKKVAIALDIPDSFAAACRVLARDEAAIAAYSARCIRAAQDFETSMRQCAIVGAYVVSVVICWGLFA